jgi:hypothetical protein
MNLILLVYMITEANTFFHKIKKLSKSQDLANSMTCIVILFAEHFSIKTAGRVKSSIFELDLK